MGLVNGWGEGAGEVRELGQCEGGWGGGEWDQKGLTYTGRLYKDKCKGL